MSPTYPFSAIVGQDSLKTALLLCAVNPAIGGVLIRGDKGVAKSTAARGLVELLPAIATVQGCHFNCPPGEPAAACDHCRDLKAKAVEKPVPFVNLPLGATEDRVLGSLDFERALKEGRRTFQPGLLAAAHRGLLYIDEVNLLGDHLVDVLLDVAAMGVNTVQREGLAISHPARITLIGTMNPEEGELRPQLLDRFGLMVDVAAPKEPAVRAEVVRRRIAFEGDATVFRDGWETAQAELRRRLIAAQALLPHVTLSNELVELISAICCEFEVASLRADLVMHRTARTLAALDGRAETTVEDVRRAAELALPHRRRRTPFDEPSLDTQRLDQMLEDRQQEASTSESDSDTAPPQDSEGEEGDTGGSQVFGIAQQEAPSLRMKQAQSNALEGRRSSAAHTLRGGQVRSVPSENPKSLAVAATLQHSVIRTGGKLEVTRADLHEKVVAGRVGNFILFVVDASGSMAARRRMELVKGAVMALLGDAYVQRDTVGVIAFRGALAELLLPPTRSVEQAERCLRELPSGGRTPLPHALALAERTLVQNKDERTPLLVLLSDGRANVAMGHGDAWDESLAAAKKLAQRGVPALVVDTETGLPRLGRARVLAEALGAPWLGLDGLSTQSLLLAIRNAGKPA
ncbi:magnesium chelatase subunit D family protein [Methylogaea oryzae]|uniref:Mg-protoporphyrin IX chelatase n=1 Tax=Methylogaea oryzae TaxID=1295382 RepID=A0A8D4VPP0_9GAMM|nr:magnesium chelatase subunit D family protein [Methylogaea oryzae]BBL71765.1 magnesium chelatase [Methylogaea oryzae]